MSTVEIIGECSLECDDETPGRTTDFADVIRKKHPEIAARVDADYARERLTRDAGSE